jgi:iron-sulfur cluster repair protein YtfE (RIC family)
MFGQKNNLPAAYRGAFRELGMLIPAVQKVHGSAHPELQEVGQLYAALKEKLEAGASAAETTPLVERLRTLTNQYTVPSDACLAFRKTYAALSKIDETLMGAKV